MSVLVQQESLEQVACSVLLAEKTLVQNLEDGLAVSRNG